MSRIWLINHYASTPATGIGGRHHYLARELARLGHEVTLVAARRHHLLRQDVDTDALPAEETVDGYRFVRIDVPRYAHAHDKRRILAWLVFALKLMTLLRRLRGRPDAVLYSSPDPVGYLGAERLARACKARLAFEVRDIWPLTLVEVGGFSPRHPFIRFLQWVEDRAYSRADKVISNLEGAVDHMISRGMDASKFSWVPNGIALEEVAHPQPLSPAISSQIPADGLRIGYTGTLGAANALDTLVEAASMLQDQPKIHIIVIGDGRERVKLEQKCKDLSLTNIHFLGAIPKAQVQSALLAFDICYIGLKADPLFRFGVSPNKLFDYLASARPVLYAIDSGQHDIVDRHNAGLTIPPEDPKALADAIRRLFAMPAEERERMGALGRKAVVEHYDYAKLARKMEEVLVGGVTPGASLATDNQA